MSELPTITTDMNLKRGKSSFPVKISPDIAQEIDLIATRQKMQVETLINEILRQYVFRHSNGARQNGTAFLLSIAGMFNSGTSDTSENVSEIVKDFIRQKQR